MTSEEAPDSSRALAGQQSLAWIVALGVLANLAAVSPLADHAAAISTRIHYAQHAVFFAASIAIGAGLRDLVRARPWSARVRLALAALGFTGAVAALVPALDHAIRGSSGLHDTQHAILALTGAAIGMAARDGLLARSARSSRLMQSYSPEVYTPSTLEGWIETGRRQAAKDRVLLPRLARRFALGRVLELGAGAGQTSLILRELGWDVVATDYAPFFVDHLASLGLDAHRVDATDIRAAGLGSFPTIFCQSITPLITADAETITRTYRSLYGALEVGGRLLEIHAMAARHELRSTMRLHREQAKLAGFENVRTVRNQLLPSFAYRAPFRPFAAFAELALGRYLGNRFVLMADRIPEGRGDAPARNPRWRSVRATLPRHGRTNFGQAPA